MIKLLEDNRIPWNTIRSRHLAAFQQPCIDALKKKLALKQLERDFNDYLISRLEDGSLLVGEPGKLREIRGKFHEYKERGLKVKRKYRLKYGPTPFWSRLHKVFDYDHFRGIYLSTGKWGAYEYLSLLGVKTCLYCNRNYTVVFDRSFHAAAKDKGKVRPVLDHLFLHSRYPFLGISLFNLVPACYECNTCLKGSHVAFADEDHLNPYAESFHKLYRFDDSILKENLDKLDWHQFAFDRFSISLEARDKNKLDIGYPKADINKRIFALEELYNCHKEVILPYLFQASRYGFGRIKDLEDKAGLIGLPPTNWKALAFGSFINDVNDIKLKPFAKIMCDILDKYELLGV